MWLFEALHQLRNDGNRAFKSFGEAVVASHKEQERQLQIHHGAVEQAIVDVHQAMGASNTTLHSHSGFLQQVGHCMEELHTTVKRV